MSFMTSREARKTSCLVIGNKLTLFWGARDQAVTRGSGSPRDRLSKLKQREILFRKDGE